MPYVKGRKMRSRTMRRSRPSIKKIVRSVIDKQVENKYQTNSFSSSPINVSGTLILLNGLAVGPAATERVGNRVKFTSVRARGTFTYGDNTNVIRMLLLWSRAPLSLSNMPTVNQPINPSFQNFKLLYDRAFHTQSDSGAGLLQLPLIQTIYRKINGNSTYDGFNTNPDAGFLYVYFVSDSIIAPDPTFTGQFIVSYQDQ